MKFGLIQKFWVALKIWLKINIFEHSGSSKDETWQNPEILIHVENLAQNWHFSPLKRPAKDKIWQNPERFWFVLKIWLKNEIFNHSRPAKDEICPGGVLQYQMDTGVKLALPFGENTISKNEGALGENVTFDISVSALKAGIWRKNCRKWQKWSICRWN